MHLNTSTLQDLTLAIDLVSAFTALELSGRALATTIHRCGTPVNGAIRLRLDAAGRIRARVRIHYGPVKNKASVEHLSHLAGTAREVCKHQAQHNRRRP